MTVIQQKLNELKDNDYKEFQANVVPNIDSSSIIGVRVPAIRNYAKELNNLRKSNPHDITVSDFLSQLPHQYYEENLLHGFLLEFIKDFDTAVKETDRFIPYIDNWAVCDTCHPKVFAKHTDELLPWIKKWLSSDWTYSIRYAINLLMSFYLDDNFSPEYCSMVADVNSQEYYVNMMKAWYFATAFAKQWESSVGYIENSKLDLWTHNKAIQKAVESRRVSDQHKEYLKTMRKNGSRKMNEN